MTFERRLNKDKLNICLGLRLVACDVLAYVSVSVRLESFLAAGPLIVHPTLSLFSPDASSIMQGKRSKRRRIKFPVHERRGL